MALKPSKTGSTGPKRKPAQIDEDDKLIARRTAQKWGIRRIAEEISTIRPYTLSDVQVFHDLTRLRAQWRKESMRDMAAEREEQLRTLDHVENELWEQWEKSKKDHSRKGRDTYLVPVPPRRGPKGQEIKQEPEERVKNTVMFEERCGDPQYLALIVRVQERRAAILGSDAPKRTEITGPDGAPIPIEVQRPFATLSEAQLDRIIMMTSEPVLLIENGETNGNGNGGTNGHADSGSAAGGEG
jgi:hypothetical protein